MGKFLVLTHPKEPITDSAYQRLPGRVAYFQKLVADGVAEVWSVVGTKGYAILIDLDDHDELVDVLIKNPMGQDEETEVYVLGTIEAEARTAQEVQFSSRV